MKKSPALLVGLTALAAASVFAHTPTAPAGPAPTDPQTLLVQRCSVCHSLDRVTAAVGKQDSAWWTSTVERMISKGAKLDEVQKATVLKYLSSK